MIASRMQIVQYHLQNRLIFLEGFLCGSRTEHRLVTLDGQPREHIVVQAFDRCNKDKTSEESAESCKFAPRVDDGCIASTAGEKCHRYIRMEENAVHRECEFGIQEARGEV